MCYSFSNNDDKSTYSKRSFVKASFSLRGPCKVRNETETKRNESKQIETKQIEIEWNETNRNETKLN